MNDYIKWLENKINDTLEDKDLQREHWAFCQALKKYRELSIPSDIVYLSDNHTCTYSKSMHQTYPRKCVVCGEPEKLIL